MKRVFCPLLVFSFLLFSGFREVQACGHERWFGELGYTQLLQFSPNNQFVGGGVASPGRIDFNTRWGFYGKVGFDWCGSRLGLEVPFSYDRQRLNRQEMVNVLGADLNLLVHLVETDGGIDFYWIAGTGMNVTTEGSFNNNTGAGGINLNLGPGFRYFISRESPNAAISISLPMKYTLYFGSHMSRNSTSVIGFPFRLGFSVGF